jgi:hypothetical protein
MERSTTIAYKVQSDLSIRSCGGSRYQKLTVLLVLVSTHDTAPMVIRSDLIGAVELAVCVGHKIVDAVQSDTQQSAA